MGAWYTELFYAILFPFSFAHYVSLHLALVPVDELCIMHDLQSGIACHVLIGATSSEPCGTLCIVQLPFFESLSVVQALLSPYYKKPE